LDATIPAGKPGEMQMDSEIAKLPRAVGFAAAWAAVLTVACVLIGQSAAIYVGLNGPLDASAGPTKLARPNFNTIDFATTGALKGQTVVISPCTGKEAWP
jgi:hypothetical protein